MTLQWFTEADVRAWPRTGDWHIGPGGRKWHRVLEEGDLGWYPPSINPYGGQMNIYWERPFVIEAPGCYIGSDVTIGREVQLGHHCEIGDGCYLGDGFNSGGNVVAWSAVDQASYDAQTEWEAANSDPPRDPVYTVWPSVSDDSDWDGWPWTKPTVIGKNCYFDGFHWNQYNETSGQYLGGECYMVAGTTVGDDCWFGSDCYCWGKPTIGDRNTFKNEEYDRDGVPLTEPSYASDCYIWNGAVIGNDNVFGASSYIGLVYNPDFDNGVGYYNGNFCHDARDFGDTVIGSNNTVGQDFYCWGPFANSSSMGDNNVMGEAEFFGSRISSNWEVSPDVTTDFFFADCTGSYTLRYGDYKQTIIGDLDRVPTDWVPPEVVNDVINPKFDDNLNGWSSNPSAQVVRDTNPPVSFWNSGYALGVKACARMTSWQSSATPDYPLWTVERPVPVGATIMTVQTVTLFTYSYLKVEAPRILFNNGALTPVILNQRDIVSNPQVANAWGRWWVIVEVPTGATSYSVALGYSSCPPGYNIWNTLCIASNHYVWDVTGDSPGWEWSGTPGASRSREIHERPLL